MCIVIDFILYMRCSMQFVCKILIYIIMNNIKSNKKLLHLYINIILYFMFFGIVL